MANIHGRKTWRFTYHFDGKRKLLTLGNYPDISLALARELASQKRALLAQGIDPQEHAKKRLHSFFDYEDSKQQPTITPQELPKLFRTIFYADKMTKITQLLIEWQLLTMLHPKEASSLKWSDIDWENLKIVIPAEK